jgi:predicted AAA+ superfamily ATPase
MVEAMAEATYRRRIVDDLLDELLAGLPAIAIDGAKGVGKTFTASQRAVTTFALDQDNQRSIVTGEPGLVARAVPPVLIDEWQRVPSTWDAVRRAVDSGAAPGQFLLTGSAEPRGLNIHSGAGRIVSLRMRPLSLAERLDTPPTVSLKELLSGTRPPLEGKTTMGVEDYTREILRSGFPGLRNLPESTLRRGLDGYLERVVDRDFEELGRSVRNPVALRRWLTAYAAATGTTATWERIRDAASTGFATKPSRATTQHYGDVLQRLWLVDPLPGWAPTQSPIHRVTQTPKHHLADPSLAARLLGVSMETLLSGANVEPLIPRDGPLLGALFESLVTLSVRVYADANDAQIGHFRTKGGEREVDLIVERRDRRVLALEVKLGGVVDDRDVRHLVRLREDLGDLFLDAVVINTGPQPYRRHDGIAVIPAALLGP